MYEEVRSAARAALLELLDAAALKPGQQVVIGCSSSEIMGQKIGKSSTPEAAKAVVAEILPLLHTRGLYQETADPERARSLPGGAVLRAPQPRPDHGACGRREIRL